MSRHLYLAFYLNNNNNNNNNNSNNNNNNNKNAYKKMHKTYLKFIAAVTSPQAKFFLSLSKEVLYNKE